MRTPAIAAALALLGNIPINTRPTDYASCDTKISKAERAQRKAKKKAAKKSQRRNR